MPSVLNSALVAALAAGAVVAATAIGEPGDGSSRARAARAKPVLIAPTRAQAIEAAALFRERANGALGRRLGVPVDRLLAAERAIVARQLAEAVDHRVLSPEQRDALLACFDDAKGCDRGALPVLRDGLPPGGVPLPAFLPAPPSEVGPIPRPVPRARVCFHTPRRAARRRRAARCEFPLLLGPAAALAKELSLPRKKVAAALRGTMRSLAEDLEAPGGPPADPDGVPLGVPVLLFPFPVGAFAPHAVVVWDPGPLPAPKRPRRP